MTTLSDLSKLAARRIPVDQYLEIEKQGATAAMLGIGYLHNPYAGSGRMLP
jgi:hypothetical protein